MVKRERGTFPRHPNKFKGDLTLIKTRITELLGIRYPIFQGGMAWVADSRIQRGRTWYYRWHEYGRRTIARRNTKIARKVR